MKDIESSVAQLIEAYKAAVLAKDVEAFMRLYAPAARVFDTWGVWSYEGSAAWQRAVEGWLTTLGTERVKVSFSDVQTTGGSDMATVSAIVTYAGISAQGEPLRAMENRLTWVLRTTGHVLRVVHEHTSVPISFDESKAILQREGAR